MWERSCKKELGVTQPTGIRSDWAHLVSPGAPLVFKGLSLRDMYPGPQAVEDTHDSPIGVTHTEEVSSMLHAAPVQTGVPMVSRKLFLEVGFLQ